MNKDQIIYVGGFRLPDQNGSAIRANDISKTLIQLNYTIHLGGLILDSIKSQTNIKYWDYSLLNGGKIKRDREITPIIAKVNEIGKENLKAIIAYNYAPLAFYKLYQYCKKEDIVLIPDITEWYLIDGKISFQKVLRMWLTNWRINIITPKCKNIIVAVIAMQKKYNNKNVLVLPQISSIQSASELVPFNPIDSKKIKFIYSGYPGKNFSKDALNKVIKALNNLRKIHQNFSLTILGLDRETAIQFDPSLSEIENSDWLIYKGRISHENAIIHLQTSDFMIFIRESNRVSNYGFPGKVKEAFEYGIPVITNNTSDLNMYITHNENGFILENNDISTISSFMKNLLQKPIDQLNKIKENTFNYNPFYNDLHNTKIINFFKNLKS